MFRIFFILFILFFVFFMIEKDSTLSIASAIGMLVYGYFDYHECEDSKKIK